MPLFKVVICFFMLLISIYSLIVGLTMESKPRKPIEFALFTIWFSLLVGLTALNGLAHDNLVEIGSYAIGQRWFAGGSSRSPILNCCHLCQFGNLLRCFDNCLQ
ncbi:hypothetical protein F4805DRAFT_431195 [Annulohypoxylon moriforme]|nr:hypothetical protein F4805DRAFT_431195 [Annulohypoxylon moriforme]